MHGVAGVTRDTRGGVFILVAVGLLMLATATAVGVDFARSSNFKSALQGAVDSAAIAGASLYVNNGYASEATTAATNYMTNAIPNLPKNNGITKNIVVSASAPWTVTVTANGTINTSFGAILEKTVPISATATAHGPTNPNIDFYLLLDSSPSMAIAATQAGINTMVANTQGECDSAPNGGSNCGCAFACHESNPGGESYYLPTGTMNTAVSPNQLCTATPSGPNPQWWGQTSRAAYYYCPMSGSGNPGGEDNFALAQNLGVTLRIDNVRSATQSLMTTATATAASNSAQYRAAIYTFDVAFNTIQTLTSNLSTAETNASNIQQLEVYQNSYLTSSNDNNDTDTNYDNAMTNINTTMPNPGNGTNASGDTPQEVLMFVTDGVEDETISGNRQQSLMSTSWCTTIKNRGIRVAVLYLTYYPLPTNGWYNSWIAPFQPNIAANMQSCASPGLFFQVDTGGDITAAMTALFTTAVQTAYISN
jgi:hypothetical protein